jgi:hypothetical protein
VKRAVVYRRWNKEDNLGFISMDLPEAIVLGLE